MAEDEQSAGLDPISLRGLAIYQERLKPLLEPEHNGKAVAIHVETGEYAVARTHTLALDALLKRYEPDGKIVTLTIGPPTAADFDMAYRMLAGQKR